MIAFASVIVFALLVALGIAGSTATAELRGGRRAFAAGAIEARVEGALAQPSLDSVLLSAAIGRNPGERVRLSTHSEERTVVAVEAECLAPTIWLVSADGIERDLAGRPLAAARRGRLVRLSVSASDSSTRVIPIARPNLR